MSSRSFYRAKCSNAALISRFFKFKYSFPLPVDSTNGIDE